MSDIENTEIKEEVAETIDANPSTTINKEIPTNIWLQFDTISIGTPGSEIMTFDLRTIFAGLSRLGQLQIVPLNDSEEKKD